MSINIRNFCIIAHIDHGKSTLADRFIQEAKLVADRDFQNQMLDNMDIERERGITIKSQAVALNYEYSGDNPEYKGKTFILNLVDTPGHVDFSYEVSRAISSCEGALLLIDATQGVQAQTLSNMYLAFDNGLEIIPVINKIDMPAANIEMIKKQIDDDLGLYSEKAVPISAKNGIGIKELMNKIVESIPYPKGNINDNTKALIFDAHYDNYKGVMMHVRVFDGSLNIGDTIAFYSDLNQGYNIEELGKFKIKYDPCKRLEEGEVGYVVTGLKNISKVRVGDTLTLKESPCKEAIAGFKAVKPVVFSCIYPIDADDYEDLQNAIDKLKLNDASLVYEKASSQALGSGFKCGFLGLLHLEIVQERLEREFDISIILTSPTVAYHIELTDGSNIMVEAPQDYPLVTKIKNTKEPYIIAEIITPEEFLGNMMTLCNFKRGIQISMNFIDTTRVKLVYEMPLAEILFDFYDKLKSMSKGYATFDYNVADYRDVDVVKLDILLNNKIVDPLSMLTFRGNAERKGRAICKKLKEEIPKKQFQIPIQGAIGGRIVARETISALRKDVLAKCYGGDISRKRKLLDKQKEGKKKMKMIGDVELPQKAFLSVLKAKDEEV